MHPASVALLPPYDDVYRAISCCTLCVKLHELLTCLAMHANSRSRGHRSGRSSITRTEAEGPVSHGPKRRVQYHADKHENVASKEGPPLLEGWKQRSAPRGYPKAAGLKRQLC